MERTESMTAASAPAHELSGSYVDWPAIFAGTVVATAVAALFAGFGAALGLSAISAEPGEGSGTFALILTGLWMVLTMVVSYMSGGYIAGRMSRRVDRAKADEVAARDGINGLVVWGLGMILGAWLLSAAVSTTASAVGSAAEAAGSAVGTAVEATGSAVGGLAQAAGAAVGAVVPDEAQADPIGYVNDTLLRPTEANAAAYNTENLARETSSILANVLATGEISDEERAYLTSAVAARTGLSEAEVDARVDQAIAAAQDARAEAQRVADEAQAEATRLAEEARQTAIEAAEAARIGAILTGFALAASALVGAAAALIGAVRGGRHRDEGKMFGGFSYR